MKSSIRALAELVLQNIDTLEADCARRGADIPSLQDPYKAGTEFTLEDADVQNASTIIIAAAQQLIQTIQSPQVNLLMNAYSVRYEIILPFSPISYVALPDHTRGRDPCCDRISLG